MLQEQAYAPDFSLPGTGPDVEPTEIAEYSLSEYTDRGAVVLTFYLFDFNPHCMEHMCSLRDLMWFDLIKDTTILAISTDRTFSHRAFADHYNLEFPLLSDSDGGVSESYDVLYDEFKRHRRIAKRAVFVIDSSQTIQYAWSTDDPQSLPEWDVILSSFKTTGELPSPVQNPSSA